MIDQITQQRIIEHLRPYHPDRIGIFGSYARSAEVKADSDLDILVSFRDNLNLLDLIGIEQELSEILGIKVDLVTERSVHPAIKPYIEKDLKIILNDKK